MAGGMEGETACVELRAMVAEWVIVPAVAGALGLDEAVSQQWKQEKMNASN